MKTIIKSPKYNVGLTQHYKYWYVDIFFEHQEPVNHSAKDG